LPGLAFIPLGVMPCLMISTIALLRRFTQISGGA